jgi:glucose/arabinose dehydrogenase
LFTTNHGYEVRGSRPIANAKDEFHLILPGAWYGWPDYSAGQPVNQPHFKPEGRVQPELLLAMHPSTPPTPFATFSPKSYVMGFDFNTNPEFGAYGDAYVAEFGSVGIFVKGDIPYSGIGHKVSKIDMTSGLVTTFAINKTGYPASLTGSGGFSHPIDAVFGPDGALYILDFASGTKENPKDFQPNTGVIWKISKLSS